MGASRGRLRSSLALYASTQVCKRGSSYKVARQRGDISQPSWADLAVGIIALAVGIRVPLST